MYIHEWNQNTKFFECKNINQKHNDIFYENKIQSSKVKKQKYPPPPSHIFFQIKHVFTNNFTVRVNAPPPIRLF